VQKRKTGRSSKDVPKGMQTKTKLQKVVPKGTQSKFSAQKSFLRECRAKSMMKLQKKSFLRERRVSFLLKSCFKGNAEPNATEIIGEEVQKSFLRGCRT
jgi:hypothetical protein